MEHHSSHKRKPDPSDVDPVDDHNIHISKRPRVNLDPSTPPRRPALPPAFPIRYRLPPPPPPPSSLVSLPPPSPPPPPHKDLYIPPLVPSINYNILHELDLESILRNPQLRHDLLFDPNLQFRQNTSRRRQLLSDQYWHALSHELDSGCACIAYDALTGVLRPTTPCHYRPTTSNRDDTAPGLAPCGNSTSRLVPMLKEFKKVLENVIAPPPLPGIITPTTATTPTSAPASPPGGPSGGSRHHHPSYLHSIAEVRSITDHVDFDLMAREMRMGLYEPEGLITLVGATLKRHCAPMRDGMVERMVQGGKRPATAATVVGERWEREERQTRTVGAFRMCFEVLEVMKLDIANHQVQQIRPFLLKTTPEFELRFFLDQCKSSLPVHAPSFLQRGLLDTAPTTTPSTPRHTLIHTTLLAAFTHFIFSSPTHKSAMPETLRLDGTRLSLLIGDAADLIVLYMLLLLWRQLVFSDPELPRNANVRLEDWEVERMKREIWDVGPKGRLRLGQCFLWRNNGEEGGEEEEEERKAWEESMEGVVVQVVVRAEEARERLRKRAGPPARAPGLNSSAAAGTGGGRGLGLSRLHIQKEKEDFFFLPLPPPFSPLAPSSSFAASFALSPPMAILASSLTSSSSPSPDSGSSSLLAHPPSPTSHTAASHLPLPSPSSLSLLRGWIKTHLRRSSPLTSKMQDLLRREVGSVASRLMHPSVSTSSRGGSATGTGFAFLNPYQVVNSPASGPPSPTTPMSTTSSSCSMGFYFNFPPTPTTSSGSGSGSGSGSESEEVPSTSAASANVAGTGTGSEGNVGLEPLTPEIQHLSARLAKMVALHEKVYWRVYECAGWVDWERVGGVVEVRVKEEEKE